MEEEIKKGDFKEKSEIYKDQGELSSKFFQGRLVGCMRQRENSDCNGII